MFYEVKVRYLQKTPKKEKPGLWIIKAKSFSEAETKAMENIGGLVLITSMKAVSFYDYYEDDEIEKGKFFIVETEMEDVENKIKSTFLAYSSSVAASLKLINVQEYMTVKSAKETKIIDIIE